MNTEGGPLPRDSPPSRRMGFPSKPSVISRGSSPNGKPLRLTDNPFAWQRTPSPNEEPLHLMKNPFAYRRTPSPNGEPLHLKKNPFFYTEAYRLKVHTVTFSEVLLSRLCRLLLSRMSTPWRVLHRKLVASRQSPLLAQRLLASWWSPTPTPRHVSSRGSLSARRMVLASVTGPSSFEKTLD